MALPPQFLEELRARTPLPTLIGRRVKLARSGRQWKGCCPFHGEKTPSFYVYDDHFHCFGCGVHGDAISFVMQIGGCGFMDAVQQLAAEAGLDVPQETPDAAAREKRRHDLHAVLEAALVTYRRALAVPEGRPALGYLRKRGLTADTIDSFGLGWAGEGRGALVAELGREGISPALMEQAGLLRASERGGPARELFFNRVIFPIRDRRGRLISFGGRTLGDGQPKYLNGPETPVFSKRRTLFALERAREGMKHAPLMAVEGYMDVIALHQEGFTGAVAPLGTALTSEQLEELWRLSSEPILCFDGDAAGRRAALRAMEQALPLLAADRTLKIVTLPEGQDPDSLLQRGGPSAFRSELSRAQPLAEALFLALREGAITTTPEGRASFRKKLKEASDRITDRGLSKEYWNDWYDKLRPKRFAKPQIAPPARPTPDTDSTTLKRLRLLTAILLRHPVLLPDLHDAFCRLELPDSLDRLRNAALDWSEHTQTLDSERLLDHLREYGLAAEIEQVFSAVASSLPACGRPDAMPAEARKGWWHFYELVRPDGLDLEIEETRRSFRDRPDEAAQRLIALCTIRESLRRGEHGLEDDQ